MSRIVADPNNQDVETLHYSFGYRNYSSANKEISIVYNKHSRLISGIKHSKNYINFYRCTVPGKNFIRFEKHIGIEVNKPTTDTSKDTSTDTSKDTICMDKKLWHVVILIDDKKILFYSKERPIMVGKNEHPFVFRINDEFKVSYHQEDQCEASMIVLNPSAFKECIEEVRMEDPEYAREKEKYRRAVVTRNVKKDLAGIKTLKEIMEASEADIVSCEINFFTGRTTALKLKEKIFEREKKQIKSKSIVEAMQPSAQIDECDEKKVALYSAKTIDHKFITKTASNVREYAITQANNMRTQLEYHNVLPVLSGISSYEKQAKNKNYIESFLFELNASFAFFSLLKNKFNLQLM